MASRLTALFLAVLIGSPFCCCLAGEEVPTVPAAEHACCEVAAGPEGPERTEGSEPCGCGEEEPADQRMLLSEAKPVAPSWSLLAEISWEAAHPIRGSSASGFRGANPFPDAARPPGKVLTQVHCRYLL